MNDFLQKMRELESQRIEITRKREEMEKMISLRRDYELHYIQAQQKYVLSLIYALRELQNDLARIRLYQESMLEKHRQYGDMLDNSEKNSET